MNAIERYFSALGRGTDMAAYWVLAALVAVGAGALVTTACVAWRQGARGLSVLMCVMALVVAHAALFVLSEALRERRCRRQRRKEAP